MLEQAYEEAFCSYVSGLGEAPAKDLCAALAPGSVHRLPVYQGSFIGRTVRSLSATLFPRALAYLGADVLCELVARYLKAQAPQNSLLVPNLRDLAEWTFGCDSSLAGAQVSDLLSADYAAWELLHGPDPAPLYPQLSLIGPATLLWPRAEYELGPWLGSEEGSGYGVLLIKVSPLRCELCPVPKACQMLAAELVAGNGLMEAVDVAEGKMAEADAIAVSAVHSFILGLRKYLAD